MTYIYPRGFQKSGTKGCAYFPLPFDLWVCHKVLPVASRHRPIYALYAEDNKKIEWVSKEGLLEDTSTTDYTFDYMFTQRQNIMV